MTNFRKVVILDAQAAIWMAFAGGIMFVIVKNLHSGITIDDLERFVVTAAEGRFFQKKGTIKALKIIELVDKKGKAIERHGLVRVTPDTIKKRLIKSLNGCFLGDTKLSVSEYVVRHWSIDRRARSLAGKRSTERRKVDRRRPGLRMVEICEKSFSIQAISALAREFPN